MAVKKTKKTKINRIPRFSIGQMVIIKSYPKEHPITGDPLSLPPIMLVCGIEVENSKKKTHDNNHGEQIAEFVKYKLVWFDAKKSAFIEKVMYESFLMLVNTKRKLEPVKYAYGELAKFKSYLFNENLKNISTKETITRSYNEKGKLIEQTRETDTISSLLSFISPDFVMIGLKINEEKDKFDDEGNLTQEVPKRLIKIMWYNAQQQKYSEYEIAENCLIKQIK